MRDEIAPHFPRLSPSISLLAIGGLALRRVQRARSPRGRGRNRSRGYHRRRLLRGAGAALESLKGRMWERKGHHTDMCRERLRTERNMMVPTWCFRSMRACFLGYNSDLASCQ